MANSDESFIQKDAIKYESAFSWTFKNTENRCFSKFKELKIYSCEVKWKLSIMYDDDYLNSSLHFSCQGENVGLHSGYLTYNFRQNYENIIKDGIYHFTKNNNNMKLVQRLRYRLSDEYEFSGTITISNCDCIQKPNIKKLSEENVIQLQSDIHTQWKDKQFTDIDIKVDNTCFPVHKFILRSRSPVFSKMLEHDMKENQDNCIIVSDTDEMTMENFLSFLYSGSLEDDSFNNVIGLYSLADKYQVTSLQQTCRSLLISKLSESTVLEILKASELHTDEELKQKTTQFICDRFPKIEVSPEWSSLIDSNPRLASYVLRFVSTKCSSNN